MTRWIALLRGVNVAGTNRLPMAELRAALTDGGFENVRTYIQSGNVVLDTLREDERATLGAQVISIVQSGFGFSPATYVMTLEDLESAIAANPFTQAALGDPRSVHFCFLFDPLPDNDDLETIREHAIPGEDFALNHNVLYVLAPGGFGRSKLVGQIVRVAPAGMTARNYRTVLAIRDLAQPA